MYLQCVTIGIFLLYFYYITQWETSPTLPKPTLPYTKVSNPYTLQLSSYGPDLHVLVNGKRVWRAPLPQPYLISSDKIIEGDACLGQPNGAHVLATGKNLYQYLQHQSLSVQPFEKNADTTLQDKRVFFFTCQNSHIHSLQMCPPGQLFQQGQCKPICPCTGRVDGTRLMDPYDIHTYWECEREQALRKTCPSHTVFLHDRCVDTHDATLYCQFHTEPKILNAKTLLVCRDQQLAYETCPPGFRYYHHPVCESDACEGQLDGARVGLPSVQNGPFKYSPGYWTCKNEQLSDQTMCWEKWDSYLSEGDDLTHLPMVFDGSKCDVPTFCKNVTSTEADIVVPVHEFTKHVRNWNRSEMMDSVTGYECPRKRVAMDPGQRIGKRFKRESACDGRASHVPISGRPDAYYDCQTHQIETCPPQHYFDAEQCVPRIEHSFQYNGLDLFTWDALREDNWIIPWDYDKKPRVPSCSSPESVYLETYNVCSHPDCIQYPFLMQTPFRISFINGLSCIFKNNKLVKEPSPKSRWFWSQRPTEEGFGKDDCVPGSRLQTGHFVWDATLYRTCNEQQPFVFCPSSDTRGIERVEGKKYACQAPGMTGFIPPHTKVKFAKNEVIRIRSVGNTESIVWINGTDVLIPTEGLPISDGFELETVIQEVLVDYAYRVTYPPDVVLAEESKVSAFGGAFLMKRKDFTRKSLGFPSYQIKQAISGFTL